MIAPPFDHMCESPSCWGRRSNTCNWHHYACGCKALGWGKVFIWLSSKTQSTWCTAKCEIDIQTWDWHLNMSLTFKSIWHSNVRLTSKYEFDVQMCWTFKCGWHPNVRLTSKYEFDDQMWVWHPNVKSMSKYEFDVQMCLTFKCDFDIQIWDWHSNTKRLTVKGKRYFWHF